MISEAEIDFIKKRRIQIESDLEKESDYEHFNTVILENVTINDTYRVVYSDNKITWKGKEYACFIDTLMKKFNNYNQTYQPFEPKGPEFYSGFYGVNFQNCPLFSERVI
jgi:spore coat polysaccharide biosynthesis protein SpsF (cytidylyltransferase family)